MITLMLLFTVVATLLFAIILPGTFVLVILGDVVLAVAVVYVIIKLFSHHKNDKEN